MTELEFQSLARDGYNRIPLIAEHFADLDTPLSLYLKLAHTDRGGTNSFLLESVVGGERFGRYSFIGLPARTSIRARGYGEHAITEVVTDGKVVESMRGNPLDNVAAFKDRFRVAVRTGLPRFSGGLAGYFGYEVARHIEPRLIAGAKGIDPDSVDGEDPFDVPDILLLLTEEVVVVDNLAGKIYVIVYADPTKPEAYGRAKSRLRELRDRLRRPVDVPYSQPSMRTEAHRGFAKDDYLAAVCKAKEMIAAGEVMQVQIGQRIVMPFRDAPLTAVPRAALAQSVAVSLLLQLRRFPRGRLVARDPRASRVATAGAGTGRHERRWRRHHRHDPAARGHATARRDAGTGRGAREGTARGPEGDRRARDADRSRAQRRRSHCRDRQRAGDRAARGREVLARDAHRVVGRGPAEAGPDVDRRVEGHVPGRHAVRGAEGPRDGDHRRARADPGADCTAGPAATSASRARWTSRSRSAPAS